MSLSEDTVGQSSTAQIAHLRHPGSLGSPHEWIGIERLVDGSERVGGMLIRSAQFKRLFASIIRFAPHKATVLIQGESGTGKELVARVAAQPRSGSQWPFRYLQLLEPGRLAGRIAALRACEGRLH